MTIYGYHSNTTYRCSSQYMTAFNQSSNQDITWNIQQNVWSLGFSSLGKLLYVYTLEWTLNLAI